MRGTLYVSSGLREVRNCSSTVHQLTSEMAMGISRVQHWDTPHHSTMLVVVKSHQVSYQMSPFSTTPFPFSSTANCSGCLEEWTGACVCVCAKLCPFPDLQAVWHFCQHFCLFLLSVCFCIFFFPHTEAGNSYTIYSAVIYSTCFKDAFFFILARN